MLDILDRITDSMTEYPELGLDGERVGGGTFGRVTKFLPVPGPPGGRLVWLGAPRTDEPLVVKRGRDPTAQTGYQNIKELELSQHLRHPNLVEVVAVHFPLPGSDKQLGLVMPQAIRSLDLVDEGFDLREKVDHPDSLRRFLRHTLVGLEYVHDMGFIHRDLKPANVLLYSDGARLADFGACVRDVNRPQDRMMTTYVYCAPEQVGRYYTRAVDLWSFGCVLFEVICGKRLFRVDKGDPTRRLIEAILRCPCISATTSVLVDLGFSEEHVSKLLWNRKPSIGWAKYIDGLGFLERAIAITGSIGNLEHMLGGLLCINPRRRMTIRQLRVTSLFSSMGPSYLIRPRMAWHQKTSSQHIGQIIPSISRIMRRRYQDEPWDLACLFTANCLYSTCLTSLPTNVPDAAAEYTRLYVTCVMVASAVRGIEYSRSDLIGKAAAVQESDTYDRLEAFILTKCCGLMDQQTVFDRTNWSCTEDKITAQRVIELYLDDFTVTGFPLPDSLSTVTGFPLPDSLSTD